MFIQIHSLHGYSAALLNRDDSGLSKRLPYGGTMRTRVSSQCLKRHWRASEGAHAIGDIPGAEPSFRTKKAVTDLIRAPHEGTYPDEVLDRAEQEFHVFIYGPNGTEKKKRQPLLLGGPEIAFFSKLFGETLLDLATAMKTQAESDNSKAAKGAVDEAAKAKLTEKGLHGVMKQLEEQTALPAGLTGALFGRMITSDPAANIEAPIHVAHAFTTHAEESESDYFTAVDDLAADGETGAGHVGETEIVSGLYYGYVVIDVAGLVSNLTGVPRAEWKSAETEMAAEVVRRLVHLIAEVTPGAKKGSTAPYGYASTMLVEVGDRQPRSLSGAFRHPVQATHEAAEDRMSEHLARLDEAYASDEDRMHMSIRNAAEMPRAARGDLSTVASWAGSRIVEAA